MKLSRIPWLIAVVVAIAVVGLNLLLPYPDSNDFYELSRLALLLDSSIKYCVNNNWGFAHPLLCWLVSHGTLDLLWAQRLVAAIFVGLLLFLLAKMGLRLHSAGRLRVLFAMILLTSPWVIEMVYSVHLDIVPIVLVLGGVFLATRTGARPYALVVAGFIVGMAYWFRFHFLVPAVLFPVLTLAWAEKGTRRWSGLVFATPGVAIAVAIPHVLTYLAYGVLSLSNQKFVLSQALGLADWSPDFASQLDTLSLGQMLAGFDYGEFIIGYAVRFLKSGTFPFLCVLLLSLAGILSKRRRNQTVGSLDFDIRKSFGLGLFALISVVPFTLLRGFTFRLEATFIILTFPALFSAFSRRTTKLARVLLVCILLSVAFHHAIYWRAFAANRSSLVRINKAVNASVPESVLASKPYAVLVLVDFYNPHHKYRLCNPMVFAGWGVRFKPFVEKFGLLDLRRPFGSETYRASKYILLPPTPTYFEYSEEIVSRNLTVFRNKNVLVLKRTEDH